MLQLYTTEYCSYCTHVEAYLDEVGIPYEVCSTQTSDAYRDDIITKGGKMQVPFLVDTNNGTQMYESGDIIEYVTNTYAGKTEKS